MTLFISKTIKKLLKSQILYQRKTKFLLRVPPKIAMGIMMMIMMRIKIKIRKVTRLSIIIRV